MNPAPEQIVGVTDSNRRVVEITPLNLDAALNRTREWFSQGRVDGVSLKGFHKQSIPFDRLEFITFLDIQRCTDLDLSGVSALGHLTELRLDEDVSKEPLDLSPLRHLTLLSIDWGRGFTGFAELHELQTLIIRRCKARSLKQFDLQPSLVDLRLILGAVESLDGVQAARHLQRLRLWDLHKLTDIGATSALPRLQVFEAENLKKVASFEALGACVELRRIDIDKCGSMPNLRWLKALTQLDGLNISGTEVVDRDLSTVALLQGLQHFAATRKKDYVPSVLEIEKLVTQRRKLTDQNSPA